MTAEKNARMGPEREWTVFADKLELACFQLNYTVYQSAWADRGHANSMSMSSQ
jgi:hypothetical protein